MTATLCALQTMLADPWIQMSTGVLTSGSLNLYVLVGGIIASAAAPLLCCLVFSIQRCRICPLYRWLARRKIATAPNRQSSMARSEKVEYRALHGPFPEDPPTREVVNMALAKR